MTEELLRDIGARLDAIGEKVSEERIKAILGNLLQEPEFARKMRFGAPSPDTLAGSVFGRFKYTAADVELLHDVMTARMALGKSGPSERTRNAFKQVSDAVYMTADEVRAENIREMDNEFDRVPKAALFGKSREQALADAVRAMDTAESGYGSQLVGAQYVASLWEAARPQSRIMSLIDDFEMTAPTVYMPVEVDIPEMLFVAENTANNASNYTTVKTGSNRVSVAAKKFLIHQMWSGEMEEDSILPFVPFLRRNAQLSMAHYGDSLILNGDDTNAGTGNINLVDADPTDTKHYLAFDGIRHACLTDNTVNKASASGGALSVDLFVAAMGRMIDGTYLHDWGQPTIQSDLVFVVDPWVAKNLLKVSEFLTMDKLGQRATLLSGQFSEIFGHPIISSMALAKSNTAGAVSTTAGNNLYGQIVAFNRRGLKWGWRRRVKVEVERIPATDQNRIVYSLRAGLGRYTPTGAASGIEWADVTYYIGL